MFVSPKRNRVHVAILSISKLLHTTKWPFLALFWLFSTPHVTEIVVLPNQGLMVLPFRDLSILKFVVFHMCVWWFWWDDTHFVEHKFSAGVFVVIHIPFEANREANLGESIVSQKPQFQNHKAALLWIDQGPLGLRNPGDVSFWDPHEKNKTAFMIFMHLK